MYSQRTLIVVFSALACAISVGCMRKKPIATYVNQNLTLNGYVEPGQVLEWRVSSPQSASFRFKPEPGFCSEVKELATYKSPAKCVVAPQRYPDGAQMTVYTYELEPTENLDHSRTRKEKGSDGQAPAGSNSSAPSSGVFAQRVGSCGPCFAKNPLLPGVSGPQTPVGPPNPIVRLVCVDNQLTVQANPQAASIGSSITWLVLQNQIVRDWTVQFEKDGVCSPKPINAGHDNCTVESNVSAGNYNYTAHLYKSSDHSPGSLVCEGTASVRIQ